MSSLFVVSVLALQLFTATSQPPPTVFVVAYDCSTSVPAAEFAAYPEMVRSAVLELLQPGDTLVLVRMDRPDDPPETFVFDSRLSRLRADVIQIYSRLRAMPQARGSHGTDLGLAFEHLRRRVELDGKLTSVQRRYVLVAATDGVGDGRQTTIGQAASTASGATDWRLVFLGAKPAVEQRLRQLATRSGFDDPKRMLIVPFSHWAQLRPSLAGFLERVPNPTVLTALARVSRSALVNRR